jgi:FKBP-type peptidyl-prolyl cis-trans isomerase FkpA
MKKLFFFSLAVFFAMQLMAQKPDETFKYAGEGVFYKIFKMGGTVAIPYGSYVEYSTEQFYDDSLLGDTKSRRMVMAIDSTVIPPSYFAALPGLHVGDSVLYQLSTDSTIEMYAAIPWVTKGHYFNTRLKIEKLFADKAEADAAILKREREDAIRDSTRDAALTAFESKRIEQYLMQHSVTYIKSPKSVYYSITKKGVGPNATKKNIVTVNYTGKTLAGTVFDSNTDPTFKHVQPLEVDLNNTAAIIKGWLEGLLYFNKGSKGTLYIPSPMGFGANGSGDTIAPNEILVFDIEVINIKNAKAPAAPVKNKPAAKPKATKTTKAATKNK